MAGTSPRHDDERLRRTTPTWARRLRGPCSDSAAASWKLALSGSTIDAERTACVAGSRPSGSLPCCAASAALRRRMRAMITPLSVEVRFSLRAVLDRPHAFLDRGVLHGDGLHAAIGLVRLLRGAVHQVVVVLVDHRPERAGDQADMDAAAVAHHVQLVIGQRARRMVREAPRPCSSRRRSAPRRGR